MRISIAMATYNGAAFLRQQLGSLVRQTLRPSELAVCDDGSSDETVSIVREFGRSAPFPVRIQVNEENRGYADTFLRAAGLCSGSAIAFCDQDDVWLERKLERCAHVMDAAGAVLVCHTAAVVDDALRPTGKTHPSIRRTRVLEPLHADPRFVIQGSSFLFDARLLEIANAAARPRPLNPDLERMGHDTWVYLLADVTGRIVMLREPLALYRQHAANVFGAGATTMAALVSLALATGEDTYRRYGVVWSDWAKILEQLAEKTADPVARERYARAATRFRRLSRNFDARSRLYTPRLGFPSRLKTFAALAARGGYESHVRGGLGARALAKDVVVVSGRVPRAWSTSDPTTRP